jgi:hypothetical protein
MGRAQVSLEYMVIVGIALGLLVPAILFFYTYQSSGESSSASGQINEIGLEMVSTTKSTYSFGRNTKQTIEFTMPDSVRRVYVQGQELVFIYDTYAGPAHAVFFSSINMTSAYSDGNISIAHPGLTRYQFNSAGSVVNITEIA